MIMELKKDIEELKATKSNAKSKPKGSNTRRQYTNKQISSWKYCWTHSCNPSHHSKDYSYPDDSYQPKATIDNMLGGSKFYVRHYMEAKKQNNS